MGKRIGRWQQSRRIFNLGNVDEVYDLLFSSLGYPVVNEVRVVWQPTDIPNITSSNAAEFALSRR